MVLLLSELFGSGDGKPAREKMKEWILFFILHFQRFFSCFIFVQLKLFPFNRRWMLDTISLKVERTALTELMKYFDYNTSK